MKRRVASVVVALGAVLVALWPSGALADAPYQVGWWSRLQVTVPGVGAVVPTPPVAPDGGLDVSGTAASPTAFSALRFALDGPVAGSLVLRVAGGSASGAEIDACPVTGSWTQGANQDYGTAPTYDCTAKVAGQVDSAGTTITWTLPDNFYRSDVFAVDVALVPGGTAPVQVAFGPPDADTFAHAPAVPPVGDTAASPSDVATAPEPSPAVVDVGSSAAVAVGSVDAGSLTAPAPATVATPSLSRHAVERPGLPRAAGTSRGERVMALVGLVALAGALWWLGGHPIRAPRLLGGTGAGAALESAAPRAPVGGIGRFARPRTTAPGRL